MNYHYRGARGRGASSRFLGAMGLVVLVVGGGLGVLWSINWFRAHAEEKQQEAASGEEAADQALQAMDSPTSFAAMASLKSNAGDVVGTVRRLGTIEEPQYAAVFNLPLIDGATQTYEMWMLKDGLADVKSAGTLTLRADGSWAHEWTMQDPLDYTNVVIMLEPNDGNAAPSGNQIAEGKFANIE